MKDTKSLTLLLLSSVLFLLSIILLCTWGYQYYHQIQDDKSKAQQAVRPAAQGVNDDTRDSLLKIYKLTLNSIGNSADSTYYVADSLNGQLNTNLQDFYRLRDEIAVLLQSQAPKTEDLITARKKITELQRNVQDLRFHNTDVERENRRLKALIEQLSKNNDNNTTITTVAPSFVQEQNGTAAAAASKVNVPASTVVAANVNLSALSNTENETVTNQANAAGKLVGSFTVKNNTAGSNWCDIIVVVTNPVGQVVQKSAWESGTFETANGKRIYSMKIRCETGNGESKKVNFSLNADNYSKGNYTMLIYHNGKVIGRTVKALS